VAAGSYPPLPPPLPIDVLDSHCHLDMRLGDLTVRQSLSRNLDVDQKVTVGLEGLEANAALDVPERNNELAVDQALALATSVGVPDIVQIGCDVEGSNWSVDVAERFDRIVAGVALHPNEAPRILAEQGKSALDEAWNEIERLAANPRVRAVGETGLDYFRTGPQGRAIQEESFRRHIATAKRYGKALVIHDRDSHDAVMRVLAEEGAPETVVFHCFSGDEAMARYCVDRGWVLSFAGTVTFKNADGLRAALRVVPLDQVLVETDAPFLTPTPFRGKPNASYLIPWTVRVMSEVMGVDLEELCSGIAGTGRRVFGF